MNINSRAFAQPKLTKKQRKRANGINEGTANLIKRGECHVNMRNFDADAPSTPPIKINSQSNRAQRRKAQHDKLREIKAHKRKSATHKRMDRPSKLEKSGIGWQKFDAFLSKVGVHLA